MAAHPILNDIRKDYDRGILSEDSCSKNPFVLFEQWLNEALLVDGHYANAMSLSTVDAENMPDSRIVLLRNISYGGFTFFTNYNSVKARQINGNPKACLLFFWKELERQVRIQGEIRFLPPFESDTYFNSRPFESKVGAWASQQSEGIESRLALDQRFESELKNYKDNNVPRPPYWGGYVLLPSKFEFWQGRTSRLHDRVQYTYKNLSKAWKMERLMP